MGLKMKINTTASALALTLAASTAAVYGADTSTSWLNSGREVVVPIVKF